MLPFALVFIAAVIVRSGCLGLVEYRFDVGDASSYRAAALTLLDQGVYSASNSAPFEPTAYRPPGYVVFLAGVAFISRAVLAFQLAQMVVSLSTIFLIWLLARKLMPEAAGIAPWLAALNPFDAVYSSAGLSECLTTFLLVTTSAALALLSGRTRLLVGGVSLGLLCLCRDIYMALVPFAAVLFLLQGGREHLRARLKDVVVLGGLCALMIAPWTVRNYAHFGKLIPISAGRLGYSLWMGTWAIDGSFTANDATGRTYPPVAFRSDEERTLVSNAGEDIAASEQLYKRLFRERVKEEPMSVVGRWLIRWPRLWLGTRFDIFELNRGIFPRGSPQWTMVKGLLFGLNTLFFLVGVAGAVIAFRSRSLARSLVVPLLFTALVYLPLNSFENRYSQPMFPFLVLLSSLALGRALNRWTSAPSQIRWPSD